LRRFIFSQSLLKDLRNDDKPEKYNVVPNSPYGLGGWDADLYDNKHSFVAKYGEDVLGWLAPQKDEHILDVGCGTEHYRKDSCIRCNCYWY
jgi:hypothetical protein